MTDSSKIGRPASVPRQGMSVMDRIALFNKMAQEAKNNSVERPILPTKQYNPDKFTKRFSNHANSMADSHFISSPKKKPEEEKPIFVPTHMKYFSFINGKTESQLTSDFETLYIQNPSLWDSVIDSVRFQLRYAEFESSDESLAIQDDNPSGDVIIHTFSEEIMKEINKVRENPIAYAAVVQSRFERFVDDHVYKLQSGEYMKTVEGQEGVLEAVNFLRNTAPLPPLQMSHFLSESTMDHIDDMLANNLMGHESSNGNTLKDRIEKYCQWRGQIGENIRFGSNDPTEIIINLLIDDGVESRGQRKNILNKEFKFVGAALATHDVYRYICVMNFTGDLIDNMMILKSNSTKVLKSPDDLQDIDVKRIILSIPYTGDIEAEIRKEFDAMVPPATLQVTLDFMYEEKKAKISYKRGNRTTMRTLTWASQ